MTSLFGRRRFRRFRRRRSCRCTDELTLADVPPGGRACIRGFLPGLSCERRAHLQAYGLTPGYQVRILQHSPVTIVQVEHMELALEGGLARQVQVEGTR